MKRKILSFLLIAILLALLLPGLAETADSLAVLPASLDLVEAGAFEGDTALVQLVVPASVKTIGSRAFADCANLTSVTFESDDVVIANDAFDGTSVAFVANQSSTAEQYALAHGIPLTVKNPTEAFGSMALDMILDKGKPESGLAGPVFASQRLMVQTDSNVLPDISRFNPVKILSEGTGFFLVQFSSDTVAVECHDYLNGISGIVAEPDEFITADYSGMGIVDKALNDQWPDKDIMGMEVYSEYIQRKYPNASATVVVIDSGIAYHSALNDYVIQGYDFTGQNNPRYDGNNHGTGVAGCIVDAVYGANVKIIPIRLFTDEFMTTSMVRQAVKKAIELRPSVINISAIINKESAIVRNMLASTSIPVVVAAGNDGKSCDTLFPAGMTSSNVITVSGITTNLSMDPDSNFGSCIDVCAPSTNIASYNSAGGTYDSFHGTSYAAPQISAAIALVSMDPERGIMDMLNTCTSLGSTDKFGRGLPDLSLLADKVQRIEIANADKIPAVMQVGETCVLMYNVLPEAAENKTVILSTSDSSVLNVTKTADGVLRVVALNQGKANITITAEDGSNISVTSADITVVQPVTRITITAPGNTVNKAIEGATLGLSASVQPTDATNKELEWTSSDESIATVAQNGVVTPVAVGTVIIRAEAKDGYNAYAEFEVQVIEQRMPEGITIDLGEGDALLKVGETRKLMAVIDPEDAIQTVTWYSTDKAVLTVTADGTIEAKAPGKAAIIATSTVDSNMQHHENFTVIQPATSLELLPPDGTNGQLEVGNFLQFTAVVLPEDAEDRNVIWTSTNTSVATVDQTGKVSGVASGSAIIRATANSDSSLTKEFAITVKQLPHQIVLEGDAYVYTGESKQLTATVLPENADNKTVTWTSSNTAIATVTNTGLVTGKANGVVTITVKSNAVPSLTQSISMEVYPQWSYYDWTPVDQVPENGIVTDRKWTYTEKTQQTTSTLSGWTLVSEEWKQTATGSVRWADFSPISGFNKSNSLYTKFNVTAPTASETTTAKRTVSTVSDGYIYWHWMYDCGSGNATDRSIFYKNGTGTTTLTGNNFAYKYFGAFESTKAYPQMDAGKNWGQNDTYYLWYKVSDRTSYASSQGSYWWYRTQIKKTTYTDYTKVYNFTRNVTVTTEPVASDTITNIVAYVKYKVANTSSVQLSGWVTESQVPVGAEIVENKWTYKETITSNSASMSGWTQESFAWDKTGSGAVRWVNFSPISGFNKSNSLYIEFNKAKPVASETDTTKRVIDSEVNDGYIYWHWMYNTSSANAANRSIFYKNGTGTTTLTGNNYAYKYFGAFESTKAYEQMDAGKNWGQNDTYYLWYKVSDRTSYASSQGSYWWYRTQIKKTSYTDYQKLYTYTRTVTTTTEPSASNTVSDITKLVRYIVK